MHRTDILGSGEMLQCIGHCHRRSAPLQRRKVVPKDKPKRGPYANERVNPHEPHEIKYWTKKFNCTDMQLKHAVRAVGTSADAVRHFLQGKK